MRLMIIFMVFLPNIICLVCSSETSKPTMLYGLKIQQAAIIRTNRIDFAVM
jgi:hypothetical protein